MKYYAIVFLGVLSLEVCGQEVLSISSVNPLMKGKAIIRNSHFDGNYIYLLGDINSVNGRPTSPVIRINTEGEWDSTFINTLTPTRELSHNLTGPMTSIDSVLFFAGNDAVYKVESDFGGTSIFLDQRVKSLLRFKDSLLVLSGQNDITLYSTDGVGRQIITGLSEELNLFDLRIVNNDKVMLAGLGSEETHIYLLNSNLTLDANFEPFSVNDRSEIRIIDDLATEEYLVFGGRLVVNGIAGNGIYYVNSDGSISENSIHEEDISYVNALGVGVNLVFPLPDNSLIVAGYSDIYDPLTWSLYNIKYDGSQNIEFPPKKVEVLNNFGTSNHEMINETEFYLSLYQSKIDGTESDGLNIVSIDGTIKDFDAEIFGKPAIDEFEISDSTLIITGRFSESKYSSTSNVVAFNIDGKNVEWLDSVDFSVGDITGVAKILSSGDIVLGGYKFDESGLLQVLKPDGTGIELGDNQLYATFVEKGIENIVETADFIYLTGVFSFSLEDGFGYGVARYSKDYKIDRNFSLSHIEQGDRIRSFQIDDQGRFLIWRLNYINQVSEFIRLNADGSKDESFQDIQFDLTYGPGWLKILNSQIFYFDRNFNEDQILKTADLDGNPLDDNFVFFSRDESILDIELINDTTYLIAGIFKSINGFSRSGLAVVDSNGQLLDDIDLDVVGPAEGVELFGDKLFVTGPRAIGDVNGLGFYEVDPYPSFRLDSVTLDTDGFVNLSWESNSKIRDYYIFRSDSTGTRELLSQLSGEVNSFKDRSAEQNVLYTYEVVASNVFGERSETKDYQITIEPLKVLPYVDRISVFPNPTKGEISFDFGSVQVSWLLISDLSGKNISKIKLTNEIANYDLNLPNGIYVCTFFNKKGVYSTKKVVVR